MTTNDINAISETPEYKEALTSQSQAIHLCMRLGYTLLTPSEADELRDGRTSDVMLRKVTQRFLKKHATYHARSRVYNFNDAEIERGMQILRTVDDTAGLANANQKKYEHLCFPPAITVSVPSASSATSACASASVPASNSPCAMPLPSCVATKSPARSRNCSSTRRSSEPAQ